MAKKLTFSVPVDVEVQPAPVTEQALEARVVDRHIHTDSQGNTTIQVLVGLFNAANEQVGSLGPFDRAWPAAWDAQLDTLDDAALAWLEGDKLGAGVVS